MDRDSASSDSLQLAVVGPYFYGGVVEGLDVFGVDFVDGVHYEALV